MNKNPGTISAQNTSRYVVTALLLTGLCVFSPDQVSGAERKTIVVTGSKPSIEASTIGAVTFMSREDDSGYSLLIYGDGDEPDSALISGYDHDLGGNLLGGNEHPAVATDLSAGVVNSGNLVLEGSSPTVLGSAGVVDVEEWVKYAKTVADLTIDEDTTYDGGTIGSAADFQIVYVDDAQVHFRGDFTGYGLLAVEESSPSSSRPPRVIFEDNASWVGLVAFYQHDASGSADVSRVQLAGSSSDDSGVDIGDMLFVGINSITMGNNNEMIGGMASISGSITGGNNNIITGSLSAPTVVFGNNDEVTQDMYVNTFNHGAHFDLGGTQYPFSDSGVQLPEFPSFSAGTVNVSKGNNATYTLDAGSYRNISFGNNGVLLLSGGDYYINNLSMGNTAKVYFQAGCRVHVAGNISVGNNAEIAPQSGSGLGADDGIFYIMGTLSLPNNAVLECNVYIPNNSLTIGNNGSFEGSFIARTITMGNNTTSLTLNSAFGGGSGEALRPKIIGALLLEGREFRVPDGLGYGQVLYSQAALDGVASVVTVRPYRWKDWREEEDE